MAEKFDKLVKICEDSCKKDLEDYGKDYRTFLDAYAKGIAITATYSGVYSGSGGKSWPKDFFADAPNPATYGELFTWMYDKTYGSRYYSQKDAGEDASVYLDDITGKEYATRVAAADRVPMAKGDDDNLDDIIEAGLKGKADLEAIYKDLNRNWRDTQNYLIYKKIIEEITIPVFSEKVVKQYLDKVTNAKLKEWKKEDPGKIWRDGLQGKSSMQRDVGIIDFVAREYPLYQEVYGGNFWTTIDNPWSTRNGGPEAEQALLDAILEKSNDPSLNTPGPSMSESSSAIGASGPSASGPSASTPQKYAPFVEGLTDGYQIDAKMDLPDFRIYVSDPDTWKVLGLEGEEGEFVNIEGAYIDGAEPDEYTEENFVGDEEAPPNLPEVNTAVYNNVVDEGSNEVNNTGGGGGNSANSNGVIVSLPTGSKAYSHNSTQGYNLVDSKWYGDLLTSARAHIDHPTFDIPGTESGNLGCASWVSMVFYRAFGVHMKDGTPVKAVPKKISDFGSTGTGELGGWFGANPGMWQKIPWKEGQPGDVINTERGSQSGHVGIVIDEKHANGTWYITSNSSKGFGSGKDPLGCGKKNYNIKSWQSVTDRNPTRTFCWRYKGPKLSQGQTA
jgi:hypothetical protein